MFITLISINYLFLCNTVHFSMQIKNKICTKITKNTSKYSIEKTKLYDNSLRFERLGYSQMQGIKKLNTFSRWISKSQTLIINTRYFSVSQITEHTPCEFILFSNMYNKYYHQNLFHLADNYTALYYCSLGKGLVVQII